MPWPVIMKKLEWKVLWRSTRHSRTNTQNRCPFLYRGLQFKSRKSRNIWSNRQVWTWSTEWNRAKANRVLPGERTGHSKHPLPTMQEKALHIYRLTLRKTNICSSIVIVTHNSLRYYSRFSPHDLLMWFHIVVHNDALHWGISFYHFRIHSSLVKNWWVFLGH